MIVAHYIGNHAGDDLASRTGWWLTQLAQKGPFGNVTHTEAIHAQHLDGSVTIASSSLRDGGVRSKCVTLNPAHWLITDVGEWDVEHSKDLLAVTQGAKYDLRGAVATMLPGAPKAGRYFCNHWVSLPFLKAAAIFGPHHFAAICMTLGEHITTEFFAERAV